MASLINFEDETYQPKIGDLIFIWGIIIVLMVQKSHSKTTGWMYKNL